MKRLKHEPDAAVAEVAGAFVVECRDIDVVERIAPGCRMIKATEDIEQRRFSGTGRSDDRHELPGGNLDIDAGKRVDDLSPDLIAARYFLEIDHLRRPTDGNNTDIALLESKKTLLTPLVRVFGDFVSRNVRLTLGHRKIEHEGQANRHIFNCDIVPSARIVRFGA